MKSFLQDDDTEMCLTHNKGKSVVDERFVRSLKNKVYKCITSVSENVYIHKLDDIVNKYNNIYQITIKMRPVDVNGVKVSTYIDFGIENDDKDPKFKFGNHVKISKKQLFLQQVTFQIGRKKFFELKKLKILFVLYGISSGKTEIIFLIGVLTK